MKLVSKSVYFFKHVFIPHKGNDYKPHFFRELVIGVLLALSIFLFGLSVGSSFFLHKTILGASITASVLVDLANESRLSFNEPLLLRNPTLDRAAELKGKDMATHEYFSHDSPDGITPWHWFKEVGYVFLYAGENLAINFTESVDVQNAWLNSPKHRDNLLNTNFREIGMATVEGIYKNSPTIYVVQMFGTPALAKKSSATKAIEEDIPQKQILSTLGTSPIITTQESTNVATKTVLLALSPEVKGETLVTKGTRIATTTVSPEEKITLQKITETPELIIVKTVEEVASTTLMQEEATVDSKLSTTLIKYAPWYGTYIFNGPEYVENFYKILILVTILALLAMIFIEMRRQHYKHIAYGAILIVILTLLVYINKAFIS